MKTAVSATRASASVSEKEDVTFDNLIDDRRGAFLTDIVDHDISTEFGVHQGVCTSKTCTRSGDDDSLAIESYFR